MSTREREPTVPPPTPESPASAPGEAGEGGAAARTGQGSAPGREPGEEPATIPDTVRQRLEAYVPELVKRAFTAGMGAVFTTEEGLRRMAKDISLPKEVAGYLVNTASSTKDELLRVMAREIREFLQSVNVADEIAKMLTTLSFEVKTEIRFIPNAEKYGGVEPDVKASVRLKRDEGGRLRRRFRRRLGDDE
jgi:hypothetical protein